MSAAEPTPEEAARYGGWACSIMELFNADMTPIEIEALLAAIPEEDRDGTMIALGVLTISVIRGISTFQGMDDKVLMMEMLRQFSDVVNEE